MHNFRLTFEIFFYADPLEESCVGPYNRVVIAENKEKALIIAEAMIGEEIEPEVWLNKVLEIKRTAAPSNLGIPNSEYTWGRTAQKILELLQIDKNKIEFITIGKSKVGIKINLTKINKIVT